MKIVVLICWSLVKQLFKERGFWPWRLDWNFASTLHGVYSKAKNFRVVQGSITCSDWLDSRWRCRNETVALTCQCGWRRCLFGLLCSQALNTCMYPYIVIFIRKTRTIWCNSPRPRFTVTNADHVFESKSASPDMCKYAFVDDINVLMINFRI